MTELMTMHCDACQKDAPRVSRTEADKLRAQVPEWELVGEPSTGQLEREFSFKDFGAALQFTNQVGALAETENHHPALLTDWGRVKVTWRTHAINGLHRNDFIMAAKTDALYADRKG